ncbi:MAG: tetratricopeptide repeat protein [Patescibacteria group bacterium]|nr:tetratricopeptide repeat protein [Patescibacteria group bacterium]
MPPTQNSRGRLEKIAFYIALATILLTPIAFWPDKYISLGAIKTLVISVGVLVSLALVFIESAKARRLSLPPKSITWISILMVASLVVSSIAGGQFMKSFFGQGFESGTGIFLTVLFLSGLAVYILVSRKMERAVIIYAGIVGPYLLLVVFHALRFIFGADFVSLGILSSLTSTVLDGWYSLALYSMVVSIISMSAIALLPLSKNMKISYWILLSLSAVVSFLVNSSLAWGAAAAAFLGLAIYMSMRRPRPDGPFVVSLLKRISWLPVAAFVIACILFWNGSAIAGPVISKIGGVYSEISLPWTMTLDVTSGAIKSSPLLGYGPNRFTQAYLDNKPAVINQTDLWGVEFNSGFGLVPTFIVTQGVLGAVLWVILFVFLGISGVVSLRRPSIEDHYASFIMTSSFAAAAFLWLMSVVYVPSQAMLFMASVLTGIWLGSAVACGRLKPIDIHPQSGDKSYHLVRASAAAAAAVLIGLCLICVRDTVAMAYFENGVQALNSGGSPTLADSDFSKALYLYPQDLFWQGRAEASIAEANRVISSVPANSDASTSQQAATQAAAALNVGMGYAGKAIAYDPGNYYNYVSQARIAAAAASLRMSNAYEAAAAAYTSAIRLNPGNPSLYLSLAQLQASNNKLDDAIQTIGAVLQVKNNYLDAVFLLSQVEAAKGNLPDAITAAKFADTLNPGNPTLLFQLGLLHYENGDYSSATTSLSQAIKASPDYANAQYFLGLAYARLGNDSAALATFEQLAKTNPDNQQISAILTALNAGKSLFAGPSAKAATPEKSPSLPLKQK